MGCIMGRIMQGTTSHIHCDAVPFLPPAKAEFPDLERLFQYTRAWGRVLAVIFDHRHRGNLHIKAWLLAGPLPMLQEATALGRSACIGMYHEPIPRGMSGVAVEGSRGASLLGSACLCGWPRCWHLRLKIRRRTISAAS